MKKIITISSFVFIFALCAFVARASTPCLCTPSNPEGKCPTASNVGGKIEADAPSCTIAVGEATCGIKLSWSTWNTEPLPSFAWVSGPGIKADGNGGDRNVQIVGGPSKYELLFRHQAAGSNEYYLTNLSTVTVTGICATGSTWNRTICAPNTVTEVNNTPICGPGTHLSGNVCVTDTVVPNCGYGTHLSGNVCVADQNYNQNQINCGPGTYPSGNTCLPINNYQNNNNSYVPQYIPQYIPQPIFQPQPVTQIIQEPVVVTRVVRANTATTRTNYVDNVGTHSPIVLSIEEKYEAVGKGDTVDFTVKYKNIGNAKLTRVLLQVIVPSNITLTNSSSGGTYQQNDHTLSIVLPDLASGAEGTVYVQGIVAKNTIGNAKLVTKALIIYTTPNNTQETVMAYTAQSGRNGQTGNLGAAAGFGTLGSIGLAGFLIVIILILVIILIVRSLTNRPTYSQVSHSAHH